MYMIPKIIHYCWFGNNPKPKEVLSMLENWKKILPNYNIMEWNESNCDINTAPKFVKDAYSKKKFAFVSDFFRLKALSEFGGIYLDTDVEVIKKYDNLLNLKFFIGFESPGYLCTATIGCEKGCKIISDFLQTYYGKEFDEKPNSKLLYDFIIDKEINIKETYKIEDEMYIFPVDFFSPKDFYTKKINKTKNTYSIHYFDGTWKNGKGKFKDFLLRLYVKVFGKKR